MIRNLFRYKSNTKKLMTDCFSGPATPACLEEYMVYVYSLEYTKKPDYPKMKQLFEVELKKRGMKADSKGLDWLSRSKRKVLFTFLCSRSTLPIPNTIFVC